MVHAAHCVGFFLARYPWPAVELGILGGVDAQCCGKGAELCPAYGKLGVGLASESADVVGPVVASALSAAGCEFYFESEYLPVRLCVA